MDKPQVTQATVSPVINGKTPLDRKAELDALMKSSQENAVEFEVCHSAKVVEGRMTLEIDLVKALHNTKESSSGMTKTYSVMVPLFPKIRFVGNLIDAREKKAKK